MNILIIFSNKGFYKFFIILIIILSNFIFSNVFAQRKKAREVDAVFGITFRGKINAVTQEVLVSEFTTSTHKECIYSVDGKEFGDDLTYNCSNVTDNATWSINNTNSGINTPPSTASIPFSITFPKKIYGNEIFTQVAFSFENLEYNDLAPNIDFSFKEKDKPDFFRNDPKYLNYLALKGSIYNRRRSIDAIYGNDNGIKQCINNNPYTRYLPSDYTNDENLPVEALRSVYDLQGFQDNLEQMLLPCEVTYDLNTQLFGLGIQVGWTGWMSRNTYHRLFPMAVGAEFFITRIEGRIYFCDYYEVKRITNEETGSTSDTGKCIGKRNIDNFNFDQNGLGAAGSIKFYEYEGDENSIDILGITIHTFAINPNKLTELGKQLGSTLSIGEITVINWTSWF